MLDIDRLSDTAGGGKGGTFEFALTVEDQAGATDTARVAVTVKFVNADPTITQAAAPEQTETNTAITLTGVADDTDLPRNDALELCWSQTNGPAVVIGNSMGDTVCASDDTRFEHEVTPPDAGQYRFQFSATDESGKKASSQVVAVGVTTPDNLPPVANLIVKDKDGAFLDIQQPIILGPNLKQILLDGSGSSDPEEIPLTYAWDQDPPEPNLLRSNEDTSTMPIRLLREDFAAAADEFDLKFELAVDDGEFLPVTASVVLQIVTNQIPQAPAALGPIEGKDMNQAPILKIAKAYDREATRYPDQQSLRYVFEVWKDDGDRLFDETDDEKVTGSTDYCDDPANLENDGMTQGENTVSWPVNETLEENTVYFWRARAWDGLECGEKMAAANFFVNAINAAPSAPQVSYPPDGGRVLTRRPTLKVINAADPDINDRLFYEFRVYDQADAAADDYIAIGQNVAQSTDGSGQTAWTLDKDLAPGTTYWWKARAKDQHGTAGDEWQSPANFIVSPLKVAVQVDGADFDPHNPIILGSDAVAVKLGDDGSADSTGSQFAYSWSQEPSTPNLLPPRVNTPEINFSLARQDFSDMDAALDLKFQLTVSDSENEEAAAVDILIVFNQAPGAPGSPAPNNSEVATSRPTLTVRSAFDRDVGNYPDRQSLSYVFEVWQDIDDDQSLDEATDLLVVRSSNPCADPTLQGHGDTSWQVPEALLENTHYLWRAWVWDGLACGTQTPVATFLVNTANDPPSQPRPIFPPDGGRILNRRPMLTVQNAADADINDRLFYEFGIYADASLENPVTGSPLVPQAIDDTGQTTWALDIDLAVGTEYWWTVRARDQHGSYSAGWSSPAKFIVSRADVTVYVNDAEFDPQAPLIVGPELVRIKLDGNGPAGRQDGADQFTYEWTQTPPTPSLLPPDKNTPEITFNLLRRDFDTSVDPLDLKFQLTISDAGLADSTTVDLRIVFNTSPDAPSSPGPDDGVDVGVRPELTVSNAYDREVARYPDQQALVYIFEVWRDTDNSGTLNEAGDDRVAKSADPCDNPAVVGVLPGETATSWQVDDALAENSLHFWRARAWDGLECGAISAEAAIFVKGDNDSPATPVIKSPTAGQVLTETDIDAGIVLKVHNTTDPDINDRLTIEFVVYVDANKENLIASSPGVAQQSDGTDEDETTWTVETIDGQDLEENTSYWWQARACDEEVCSEETKPLAEFRINRNNSAPVLTLSSVLNPKNDADVTQAVVEFEIENAQNLDGDEVTYDIWLDTSEGFNSGNEVKAEDLAEGPTGVTRWTSPELEENQEYFWQVRARDEQGAASDWISQSFVVNQENEPPDQPAVINPEDNSDVNTLGPELLVEKAVDPEGDSVLYDFRLYAHEGAPFDPIDEISDLTFNSANNPSWTITEVTLDNRTCYEWQVRAKDNRNLPTSAPDWVDLPVYTFCTSGNFFIPTMPRINNPFDKGTVSSTRPELSVFNSFDGDGDPLVIVFEIFEDVDGSGQIDLFDTTVANMEVLQDDDSTITRAKVPAALEQGVTYVWRARAEEDIQDHQGFRVGNVSRWMTTASFKVGAEIVVIKSKLSVVVISDAIDPNPGTPEVEDIDTGISIDLRDENTIGDEDTNFSVGLVSDNPPALPDGRIRASEVFALGPSGIDFNPPLVVGFPHASPDCNGLEVLTYDEEKEEWTNDGITVIGCSADTVFAEVVHFSLFTVSPQDDSAGGAGSGSQDGSGDSGGGGGGGGGCFIKSIAGDDSLSIIDSLKTLFGVIATILFLPALKFGFGLIRRKRGWPPIA